MPGLVLAGLIFLAFPALGDAQSLTFTTRVEARKVDTPPPANPVVQQFYERINADVWTHFIGPYADGPVEFTYAISDRGLRVNGTHPAGILQPGAIAILRPDRLWFVVRPDARTFVRVTAAAPPQLKTGGGALSVEHTRESATMAGVVAERVTFRNVLDHPATPFLSKLAGEPIVVSVGGEAWIAPQYKDIARLLAGPYADAPFASPLISALHNEGLILRLVLRSEFFNGYEIERSVTSISEGAIEPASFDVPDGFTEIGAPAMEQPQLISRTDAAYTSEAARQKIDGEVVLQVTIAEDGSVRNPKVVQSLGYGLDESAMKSIVQWRYRPARKDGVAVAIVVTVNFRFTYRERLPPAP